MHQNLFERTPTTLAYLWWVVTHNVQLFIHLTLLDYVRARDAVGAWLYVKRGKGTAFDYQMKKAAMAFRAAGSDAMGPPLARFSTAIQCWETLPPGAPATLFGILHGLHHRRLGRYDKMDYVWYRFLTDAKTVADYFDLIGHWAGAQYVVGLVGKLEADGINVPELKAMTLVDAHDFLWAKRKELNKD